MRARSRILVAGSVLASAVAIIAAPVVVTPPPSGSCDLTATTANFSTQFAAAASGQTVCLAAGSYGTQTLSHTGQVTIKPNTGVTRAQVTMSFTGSSANGFIADGITVGTMDFNAGTYRNFTVKNSKFTGLSVYRGCGSNNTNMLMDTNEYIDIPPSGFEGRIMFPSSGSGNCGWTLQNSEIGSSLTTAAEGLNGCSDAFQGDPQGITVTNNHIFNILQNYGSTDCANFAGGWHTDGWQFIGVGSGGTLSGNFWENVEDCMMDPDGIGPAVIINNVCSTNANNNSQYGFTLGPDQNSRIEHNTLWQQSGGGGVRVYGGNSNGQSTGTIMRNNCIKPSLGTFSSTGGTNTNNFNNCVFVGGTTPTTYAGFRLAAGSPGTGGATDGTNAGIP